jgi:hypothetical protein
VNNEILAEELLKLAKTLTSSKRSAKKRTHYHLKRAEKALNDGEYMTLNASLRQLSDGIADSDMPDSHKDMIETDNMIREVEDFMRKKSNFVGQVSVFLDRIEKFGY